MGTLLHQMLGLQHHRVGSLIGDIEEKGAVSPWDAACRQEEAEIGVFSLKTCRLLGCHYQDGGCGRSRSLVRGKTLLNVSQSLAKRPQVLILHPCQSLGEFLSLSPTPLGFLVNSWRLVGWKRPREV